MIRCTCSSVKESYHNAIKKEKKEGKDEEARGGGLEKIVLEMLKVISGEALAAHLILTIILQLYPYKVSNVTSHIVIDRIVLRLIPCAHQSPEVSNYYLSFSDNVKQASQVCLKCFGEHRFVDLIDYIVNRFYMGVLTVE